MSVQWPWYLAGLLLLALPWLLHLFSRHFAPERPFPSKQFLEAAEPPKSRTRQLQYKLLFALRLLTLLALCALFAMPWFNRTQEAQAVNLINYVVIDHSLSMRSDGRWQSAQQLLNEHLKGLDAQSVKVFTFDGVLRETSAGSIPAPGYLSADYGDLIRQLDARASNEALPVHVTFITDAQQTSVPAHKNALLYGTVQQFSVKRVDSLDAVNFSVKAQARSFDGVHAHIKATLSASSAPGEPNQVYERTVEVSQGDRVVASQLMSLAAGENKELVLEQIPLPASDNLTFTVRLIDSDSLLEDNQVEVVAQGADPIPVSVVQYGDLASSSALVFVDTALRSDGVAVMSAATDAQLASGSLIRHVIAFVSADERDNLPVSLTNFVDAGGNALVVLVPSADRGSDSFDTSSSSITFVDQVHALALGRSDWPSVKLYASDAYSPDESEQVLLQSAAGSALLSEQLSNTGRIFFLHDALDGSSSNLPQQPAFVELLHSLIDYFSTHDVVPSTMQVGETLNLPSRMRLLKPNGSAVGQLTDTGKPQQLLIKEPGIYTLLEQSRERALSVTLDPAESNIAAMPVEATDAWQNGSLAANSNNGSATDGALVAPLGENIRQEIWQYLLPVFAVLLLLESIMANRHLAVKRDGSI